MTLPNSSQAKRSEEGGGRTIRERLSEVLLGTSLLAYH